MKSDLEELIEAYETEKAALEKQISEYVKEQDYLYAHYHQRALRTVNRRLDVLKDLQNPYYRRISQEERMIDHYRNMTNLYGERHAMYIEKQIRECEDKIQALGAAEFKPGLDSQEIDDALFNLADGTLKGFKLYFKTSPDAFVSFALDGNTIAIKLGDNTAAPDSYQYIVGNVNQLKSLGFQLREGQWIHHSNFDGFKDALEIKIILARLIYDFFHYDRRYDSAGIVYNS
jgi:hypothetical protein